MNSHPLRRKLSYANITSTLALVLAIGTGSAYAANTIASADIIDESIISADIKNGEVKGADIASNAVTSTKINNGSVLNPEIGLNAVTADKVLDNTLTGADIQESTLTGVRLTGLTRVYGPNTTIAAGTQMGVAVECGAGRVATGGGAYTSSSSTAVNISMVYPFTDATGYIAYVNNGSASPVGARADAICAVGDPATPVFSSP